MTFSDIDDLDAAQRQRVRLGEAIHIAGTDGGLSSWDLVLLDEDGTVLALQEISFAGPFLTAGLNAAGPILSRAGLAYKEWTKTAQGYRAVLSNVAS